MQQYASNGYKVNEMAQSECLNNSDFECFTFNQKMIAIMIREPFVTNDPKIPKLEIQKNTKNEFF